MHDMFAAIAGTMVGFVLGLVGGGGSIIAVPLLLYFAGVPTAHMAIGTSAVAVSLSALANLLMQARSGLVKWPCAIVFSISGVVGTLLGSSLALTLPGSRIIPLFGALMIIVGIAMAVRRTSEGDEDVRLSFQTARRMLPWLISSGLAVGALAGFFGIGGGFLIVPALLFATGMPIRNAVATSLAAITVFGAATAANYARAGQVDWIIAGYFVAGGVAGGLLGTIAGNYLAQKKSALTLVFAALVVVTGIYVVIRSIASNA